MVECDLAKVEVAGSNPVFRSKIPPNRLCGRGDEKRIMAYSIDMPVFEAQ